MDTPLVFTGVIINALWSHESELPVCQWYDDQLIQVEHRQVPTFHKIQYKSKLTKPSQPLPQVEMCFGLGRSSRRRPAYCAPSYGPRPVFVEKRHYYGGRGGHCGPPRGYGYGRPMMGGGGFGIARKVLKY